MNKKWFKHILPICIVLSVFIGCFILPASAKMVLIEEESNGDLTYHSLEGQFNENVWVNEGSLKQSNGNYDLKSNGWAQWSSQDSMSFAYKKVKFNYSKKAQITIETKMTSFDGMQENAGAGIMIRSGLNPTSSCIMLHFRPNAIMITYRMKTGENSTQGKTSEIPTKDLYPVDFKAVVVKGENKVHCYYKTSGGNYREFGTVPFVYGNDLYVGLGAYSQDKTFMSTAKFSGFKYTVEAPEGYTIIGGNESSGSSEPEEPEDTLPEDFPPASDVLMRETFTDGSMFDGEESVINPIWKTNVDEPNILMNPEKTNRYMYEYMGENQYYFAGDQAWTDYSFKADYRFTNEYSEGEANNLIFMVRHTDIVQYGHMYYYVTFQTYQKKRVVAIGKLDSGKTPYERMKILPETAVEHDYLADDYVNKMHNIEIRAMDNTITVLIDGEKITSYTDTTNLCKTEGNVGVMTSYAAVEIDNITVTKMTDLLGGDYDNRIGGNWNKEMPDYLNDFADKNLPY